MPLASNIVVDYKIWTYPSRFWLTPYSLILLYVRSCPHEKPHMRKHFCHLEEIDPTPKVTEVHMKESRNELLAMPCPGLHKEQTHDCCFIATLSLVTTHVQAPGHMPHVPSTQALEPWPKVATPWVVGTCGMWHGVYHPQMFNPCNKPHPQGKDILALVSAPCGSSLRHGLRWLQLA